SEAIGAVGDVTAATVAGAGPFAVGGAAAVAAITAFKIGVDKTTASLEISNDMLLTSAQKNRAMMEEWVPFADKIHKLGDAIDGTNARIAKSNFDMQMKITEQASAFK